MYIFTKNDLNTLLETTDAPLTSFYMPTHRAGAEIMQDPIRLKNLLAEAEEQLMARGMRRVEAEEYLAPARALLDNDEYWRHQSDGLALFLGPDTFHQYRLPLDFDEQVVIQDHFYLKPVLPLLSEDGTYYILALSLGDLRLLQATRYRVGEIELDDDTPTSLDEALRFDQPQKHQQYHSKTGSQDAVYHGHGGVTEDRKIEILRYFNQVDKGVQRALRDASAPLVIAAVEYLHPIYHEANGYPHLVTNQGVTGNPEEWSEADLQQRSWEIVEPIFTRERDELMNRYHDLSNTAQASADLRKIVPAAHYSKIDTLFVALDQQQWGRFEPGTDTLHLDPNSNPDNEDLLNTTVLQTLHHGGTVYALESEHMPVEAPAAAVFRY